MMALISRIANGKQSIPRDLALDGKLVGFRIRDAITVIKVRVSANRDHGIKIESGIGSLRGHVVRRERKWKWIGILSTVSGISERSGEKRRRGAQIVISEGRDAIHDSGAEPRERGVEDDITGPDATLSSVAEDDFENFVFKVRRIGQANPRSEVAILGGRERGGYAGISRNHQSGQRVGIENRLLAGNNGLDIVIFLRPWLDQIPTQAVVECQVGTHPQTVLNKCRGVVVPEIEALPGCLGEVARKAHKKVGEWIASCGPIDIERPVECGVRVTV